MSVLQGDMGVLRGDMGLLRGDMSVLSGSRQAARNIPTATPPADV
jgi:hypothetical protein